MTVKPTFAINYQEVTGNPKETDMVKIKVNGTIREASCSEELGAIRDSLELLGGKWTLLILRFLNNRSDQVIHFKKMLRDINGISAKMLSKELKSLEINLLISRNILDTRPVTVAYSITEYGKTLLPVTETLVQWGLNHRDEIISSMKP